MPAKLTTVYQGTESGGDSVPKRQSVAFLVSALAGGNIVASALRMAGALMVARLVAPAVLGLFNGIGLVQGYAPFLLLGITNGLNRELPYYVGKGDQVRVRELAAAAQAWALLLGGLAATMLLGVAVWQLALRQWALAAGWATNAITVFFLFYGQNYLQITLRTRGDFARLALVNVVQSLVLLAGVVLVWWLAFYGLCLRALLGGVIQLALLWYWRPVKVLPAWNNAHLMHLLKIGAPIFVVGMTYAYWTTLDSTLVLYHAGTRGLGLYSLVIIVGATLQLLPDALSQVLYPQMAEQFGRTGDVRVVVRSAFRPMIFSLLIMIPLVAVAWVLMPSAVRLLLPNYVAAIPAAQWSLLVPLVMCLAPINLVYNVVRRQGLYAVAILLGMVAYYGALRWLLRKGPDLATFPQAMLAGRIIFLAAAYGGMLMLWRGAGAGKLSPPWLRAE
jgi:O-antigen/teichoic acid export membrane protein